MPRKKEIKFKDKYYLINEVDYYEYHEGDMIIFTLAANVKHEVKVMKDDRGLFIERKNRMFDDCDDIEVKKYYECGGEWETDIKVKIYNLKVDFYYFMFNYDVIINGEENGKNKYYESRHAWQDDREGFYKMLKGGYAVQCVIESLDL